MSVDDLNRRELFKTLTMSGLALSLGGTLAFPAQDPRLTFAAEGARLTDACMGHFWDKTACMFRAPVLSAETVSSDALHNCGCTLWPSLIALHALVEGEKHHPGRYTTQIAIVYDGLGQYYSPDLSAYTSWLHFPGNYDAYYDDNAWVVIILVEAHLACRQTDPLRSNQYLARAKSVMADFVIKGEDKTKHPGGMRWGADPAKPNTSDRGTSSTAGSALAALMLARVGIEPKFYTEWGRHLLSWLRRYLFDTDGLVMDALAGPDWAVRKIKWTYNTGVPMRAYIEHYRLTHDADSLAYAAQMARAAIHRDGALFDQNPHDPSKKFYWDETYFVHYLVDGLLQVALVTPDVKLATAIVNTTIRNTNYAKAFLRDPADQFYWRNWRLYTVGEEQHNTWQRWTGQIIAPQYDASERSQETQYQALPVQDRPLVKTLLANAGAARLFWLISY